jgi:catechol 2,3-dioxygenase-like lactoylglutathione lyase family enzyme
MSDEFGAPPRHGWAPMVAELHVNKLEDSLQFWCELLGFEVAYRRPAEKFVYLERPEGAQIMLCQRHGRFETGPLERPLGQGVTCNPTFYGRLIDQAREAGWYCRELAGGHYAMLREPQAVAAALSELPA